MTKKATLSKAEQKKLDKQLADQNEALLAERKTRAGELEKQSDKVVSDLFFNTFGEEPAEEISKEDQIKAIVDELVPAPNLAGVYSEEDSEEEEKQIFGNKDSKKEHPIPFNITKHEGWDKKVIAYIVPTRPLEGETVDLKKQSKIQAFHPNVWKRFIQQKHFSEAKERVVILNQPK